MKSTSKVDWFLKGPISLLFRLAALVLLHFWNFCSSLHTLLKPDPTEAL
uniref:Uncharacterized protein n=1 Tax=Anguilla anguilla TaxID=7936 RepID=A0A0E9URU0_ANGAN